MKYISLCISLCIVLGLFTASCSSSLQGKATVPAESCVSQDVCGDGICGTCESCSTCSDCCTNHCDDTDGGVNTIERGVISGVYNGKGFSYTDVCMSRENLMEYSCGGPVKEVPTNLRFACSNLGEGAYCENGYCVSVTAQ